MVGGVMTNMKFDDLLKKHGINQTTDEPEERDIDEGKAVTSYNDLLDKYGVGYEIDESFVNTTIYRANNFLRYAEKESGKVGWSNASATYDKMYSAWEDLDRRMNRINTWLHDKKNNLDQETYKSFSDMLGTYQTGLSSTLDAFKRARDVYARFDSQEAYDAAVKSAEKWNSLTAGYDPEAHKQAGLERWEQYLAEEERKRAEKEEAERKKAEEEPWWYTMLSHLGEGRDTSLPYYLDTNEMVEGAKYADESNDYLVNKIIDFGTVAFPVEEEPVEPVESPFNVERVWGYYSTESSAWWTGKAEGFKGSWFGGDTSLAMDDEYVYIPYGTGTAGVYKLSIATGEISDLPVGGVTGGTYPASCVRMVKNTDPNVNGGKDILLLGNLALSGEPLKFYAYLNGIDADPVEVYNLAAARRFGDKFSVSGTWQSGIIWLRSNQESPLEAVIPINNGALQTWIDPHRITNSDQNCISELSWYPVDNNTRQDYCLISTTSDQGVHLMKGCSTAGEATEEAVFSDLAKTWGYQFFEFEGEKFIAWVSLKYGNDKPRLQIIKGDGSSLETLKSALSQLKANMVAEIALSNEANDLTVAGKAASKTLADCAVRVIDGTVYVAALGEEGGLSLFKLTAK